MGRFARCLFSLCLFLCPALCAQNPAVAQATPPTAYTLHVGTRLVLTDVTVTDKQGNPVHGLDRSAFQIFDNGKPQSIASFAEHTAAEVPESSGVTRPGVVSNSFLAHPPPVLNVLLLDITTIPVTDQMYLAEQLKKFLAATAPGGLMAVYTRAGDYVVQLQDFTADPALLRAAVSKAVPRLRQPGSWAASDLDTLQQMVTMLRPYPGRKNLIWFSGGSNLALMVDATQLPDFIDMRPLYDALETTRIAVYPVDARALTTGFSNAMIWQHLMMEDTAQATGGHAYYNSNGLEQIAARIVDRSADFYTLTYTPEQKTFDDKWHKVRVVLADDEKPAYKLSYRHGYYDDASNVVPGAQDRTLLKANGRTEQQPPDVLKAPILFSATVLPAEVASAQGGAAGPPVMSPSLKKNQQLYDVHFSLPAAAFRDQTSTGNPKVDIGTGLLAVDRLGTHTARKIVTVEVTIDPDKLRANPDGSIAFKEQLALPKGEQFLYILVWNEASGRFGEAETALEVPKPAR